MTRHRHAVDTLFLDFRPPEKNGELKSNERQSTDSDEGGSDRKSACAEAGIEKHQKNPSAKRRNVSKTKVKKPQNVEGNDCLRNETDNSQNLETTENVIFVEKYCDSDGACLHECVRPSSCPKPAPLGKYSPARKFPYELDPFQKRAIECLELGESVLVSAHTSAGKTTVAEYAVAMGLRDNHKVIYTSPIKALSNQKYRDLAELHGNNIGLITGDVSINPTASIIIMTTEILRSMLFRGSDLIREMRWVVFDEIHYIRDRERGVVWEEAIIMLPDAVKLIFLSATIPNALDLAEWICRIKHQPCHVIYTDTRPVPLQHYLFPIGGDSVHLVLDEDKNFKDNNYMKALEELNHARVEAIQKVESKADKPTSNSSDLEKLITMCHQRDYLPVIIFAFSKREIESDVVKLTKLEVTTKEEAELIEKIFTNAMSTLDEDDRNCFQVIHILPLLKRGIGLHHGGLLPIIREIVEILFQESLCKVLFSTETFSMGVNMPAKTVIFTKLKKWDGQTFRIISSEEYIQMSGRAGRRGLDQRGLVIIMFDESLTVETARGLFLGQPAKIESRFYLSYNMILNLLRIDGVDPEYMILRSFYQFLSDKNALELGKRREKLQSDLEAMKLIDDDATCAQLMEDLGLSSPVDVDILVSEYYRNAKSLERLKDRLYGIVNQPRYILKFLQPGRIVALRFKQPGDLYISWGYGVILNNPQKARFSRHSIVEEKTMQAESSDSSFYVDTLVKCASRSKLISDRWARLADLRPCTSSTDAGFWEVAPCSIDMITEVTQVIATLPTATSSKEGAIQSASFSVGSQINETTKEAVGKILELILAEFKNTLPTLDPVENIKADVPELPALMKDIARCEEKLLASSLHDHKLRSQLCSKFEERVNLIQKKKELDQSLALQRHLSMREELISMLRVLVKLGYLTPKHVVTVKGHAACEISSLDELVICELIFQDACSKFPDDYFVAMLSCFVFDEKSDAELPTDPRLKQAFELVKTTSEIVLKALEDANVKVKREEYAQKFKPVIMDVTLKWMKGSKFSQLPIPQDLFEGSVVRAFRRLVELLSQLACAARSLGNEELEGRCSKAIRTMRRGIVFSGSLYL